MLFSCFSSVRLCSLTASIKELLKCCYFGGNKFSYICGNDLASSRLLSTRRSSS